MESSFPFHDYATFLEHLVLCGTINEKEAKMLLDFYRSKEALDFSSLGDIKAKMVQEALMSNWTKLLNLH